MPRAKISLPLEYPPYAGHVVQEAAIYGGRYWEDSTSISMSQFRYPQPSLKSPMHNGFWKPGVNQSICPFHASCHTGGKFDSCTCGFYAYTSRQSLAEGFFSKLSGPPLMTAGIIRGWGNIVHQYNDVMRAQYAEIVGLVGDSQFTKHMAKQFGVPVLPYHEAMLIISDDIARKVQHGFSVPKEKKTRSRPIFARFPAGLPKLW